METEKKTGEDKLDIMDMLRRFGKALGRLWFLVVLLGILGGCLNYIRASRSFAPYYRARTVCTVSSGYSDELFSSSSYYDNATAQQLALAFPYMLRTDVMRDLMMQELGKSYINGSVTASAAADTNLFVLQATSPDPQDAHDILVAAINCFPQVAVYMVDNPQIVVREEPVVPTAPANTFSWKGPALKGAAMGVLIAMAMVLAVAVFGKAVTTEEQLKSMTSLPVLASLPRLRKKKRRSGRDQVLDVTTEQALAEPMRGMALKVRKLLENRPNKVVLVTSTLKGEGKTTVSANLARALTAEGHRVVLVDGDLRSQSVAQWFGAAPGSYGLMDCIKNPKLPVMEGLTWVQEERLAILSAQSATSRSYSVDGKGMRRILGELTQHFDYVVMDTSPAGLVADTALLCHFADAVLYVVKPDYVREAKLLDMVGSLYEGGAPLEGFVFNGVTRRSSHYGYGYGYGYQYGKKSR